VLFRHIGLFVRLVSRVIQEEKNEMKCAETQDIEMTVGERKKMKWGTCEKK
jgi:hypothetical protein